MLARWNVNSALAVLAFSACSVAGAAGQEQDPSSCGADEGKPIYIRRVDADAASILVDGRGFRLDLRLLIDGRVTPFESDSPNKIKVPRNAYAGSRILPAEVTVKLESFDGSEGSNVCTTFKYPGPSLLLFGTAAGVSNRSSLEPVVMVLAMIGLPGSTQQSIPERYSGGATIGSLGRFIRHLYLVAGYTRVANEEGFGYTLGLAVRLTRDLKFVAAVRANGDDYTRYMLGISGTVPFLK